ncbi:RagB/SusD family nutrient uptake outer membrane protein [Chryseolinea lacunae]|nr:RagB/SusD family nutrient uptake outer membrane protein [Chryseolinea lacunae]
MKIKSIILTIVLLASFSRCSDFIEEENKSNIEADPFYKTKDGYESLVNSTYSTLREVYDLPWVFEAGTDMYVQGRSDNQPESLSEYRNLTPADVNVTTFYASVYRAIQRCNTALYYNDLTAPTDLLPVRKGEIQFLRAFYYFLLVQQFGGVAIVTENFDAPVLEFQRNTPEEVYAFIISEMEQALAAVPETNTQFGRVIKRAVQHYLAKVHLTRGYTSFAVGTDFSKAATYADAAIAGQALSISFKDLFWPGKDKNAEVLFSVQYDKASILNAQSDGSNQNAFFGSYLGGEGAAKGYPYKQYTLCATKYLFDLFDQNDVRFENTFMLTFYDRYYDYFDKNASLATLNIAIYFAPSWETDEATWKAVDPARRNAAKFVPYSAAWEANTNSADRATPTVKKFEDPTSVYTANVNGNSTRDIYLARLGETYLLAAEAYLKAGDASTAMARINEVRKRAERTAGTLVLTDPADVTIDFILDERARELVGEYHRWMDLKRTGKLVERNQLFNTPLRTKYFNNGIDAFAGSGGAQKILRPIPQRALDLNQAEIEQNPGY